MHHGDHPPAHVHIKLADGRECLVDLVDSTITGPIAAREIRAALRWIGCHRNDLLDLWRSMK